MSSEQKPKNSYVGIDLIRRLVSEEVRIFSINQARNMSSKVGIKESYLGEALYHLRRNGWIIPLRRGLYVISQSVPGTSPIHEFEIAMNLVDPAAISHWSALSYHGLTDQTPRKVFVSTPSRSVPRVRRATTERAIDGYAVGETVYQFIQMKPMRFFGSERVWIGDAQVMITDPERTLLDGLSMPHYCGDFSEVIQAFRIRERDLDIDKLIDYALRLDTVIAKRLGWILESIGYEGAGLARLTQVSIKGYRKLDPTGPRKGRCNRRWKILENLPGMVTA